MRCFAFTLIAAVMGAGPATAQSPGKPNVLFIAVDDLPHGVGGSKFAPLDCKDEDLREWNVTGYAIDQLKKKHDKRFFLACGLFKPHMPWNVPRKYYDMHPLSTIQLPPYLKNDLDDVPPAGVRMAKPHGDH